MVVADVLQLKTSKELVMKIAITGATGQLGRLVVADLKAANTGNDIIALVRSADKAADLGVNVRIANYDEPDTLLTALAGVDIVLLISGSEIGKRVPQHRAVIEAAQQNDVKHIVYTSLLNADSSTLSLAAEHKQTEALIKESGLTYTLLRNGWYTENYTASLPAALQAGALVGSAGDGRISSASRADYAAAAVTVLKEIAAQSSHENRTYELAGDTAYTLADLAAEAGKQVGQSLPFQNLPANEFARILASAGLPEAFATLLADVDLEVEKGALFHEGRALSQLIGRPTTTLSDSVAAALAK